MMDGSIFTKIIKREVSADIIYEDDDFIVILDIKPNNHGHSLLIPKEPHINIFDMPDDLLVKIGPILKRLSIAIKKAMGVEGINILMNNGEVAGQIVLHAHIHIVPRTKEDDFTPRPKKSYKDGEAEIVAEKIRSEL
jgi:histidine triad (HIT) family protein